MMATVSNRVIAHIFVGEHKEDLAPNLAKWLTRELGLGISDIDNIWSLFQEAEEPEDLPHEFPDGEEWLEDNTFEGSLAKFYRTAKENGATRIIVFNNSAYIDLVAIAGHPTSLEIAVAVLGEENVSEWSDDDTSSFLGKEFLTE